MLAVRHLRSLFLSRWWMSLKFMIRGIRIHPSAFLNGGEGRFNLSKGVKIGARCKLDGTNLGVIGCGRGVWISTDVEMETATTIYVGEGTTVQRRCTINGSVRIGVGCIFAPNVFVSSGTHPFKNVPHLPIRVQERKIISRKGSLAHLDCPIWIQDDCWLGINVVVCPGVTVGKGSVVGANAVVTKDVAPYSIVAGVPAKVIGRRLDWRPKKSLSGGCEEDAPYILSGLQWIASDDVLAGVKVTNEVPFRAVLHADRSSVKVRYQYFTTHDTEVMVSGKLFNVGAGEGFLEVSIDRKVDDFELVYCDLAIDNGGSVANFLVVKVSCVF